MNDAYEALKTAFLVLIGITVAIVSYFAKRTAEKVDVLKETAVTRDEMTSALDRIETRQRLHHGENRDLLERIVTKIDANEERAAKTRHDTKDEVHSLAVKLATFQRDRGVR